MSSGSGRPLGNGEHDDGSIARPLVDIKMNGENTKIGGRFSQYITSVKQKLEDNMILPRS